MILTLDFGITNVDILAANSNGDVQGRWLFAPPPGADPATLLDAALAATGIPHTEISRLIATGGRSRLLPAEVAGKPVQVVDEFRAIGRGGLILGERDEALVVSAGSGTALVMARGNDFAHVGGTAVGGGTLMGLGRLLLQTAAPSEIERLAQEGNSTAVDLTIGEVIGGEAGMLPSNATAVNFGRLARLEASASRADVAAGLTTMVAQTVGILACVTARGLGLDTIVVLGHLTDLPSVVAMLQAVAQLYGQKMVIPTNAGQGVAIGALHEALRPASRPTE